MALLLGGSQEYKPFAQTIACAALFRYKAAAFDVFKELNAEEAIVGLLTDPSMAKGGRIAIQWRIFGLWTLLQAPEGSMPPYIKVPHPPAVPSVIVLTTC